ncbi:hypothetical protein AB0L59_01640 [Streptomyces sp. NPDC052109]|uniref:hypothetical protein n=1 Tax=Streptomyces sp. NPDC052109 TaxID=3155527 RepID=UPI00341BFAE8
MDLDTPKTPDDTPPAAWALPGVTDGASVLAVLCERHGQPFPCAMRHPHRAHRPRRPAPVLHRPHQRRAAAQHGG